jgi:integrase
MASTPRFRSGSYRVEWRLGGKRTGAPQSVTFPGTEHGFKQAEAAKALAEANKHNITDDDVYQAILGINDQEAPKETPTFAEWFEEWHRSKKDVEDTTLTEYVRLIRSRFLPHFGKIRLADIDWPMLLNYYTGLTSELMPAGIKKIHVVVHQILGAAVPEYVAENPAEKPKGKKSNGLPKVKRHNACYLTPEEAEAVWNAAAPEFKDFVKVAFGTGLRLGELLGMRVSDLKLDAKKPAIVVEQTFRKNGTFGGPKSERSERSVTISKTLVKILRARCVGRRPHELIFPSPEGQPWNQNNLRRRYWTPTIIEASRCPKHPPTTTIKCGRGGKNEKLDPQAVSECACKTRLHQRPRIHDTRHSHVGWLIDAGWDPYTIQHRIGHESIKTTYDTYGHLFSRGSSEELDALDKMLTARVTKAAKAGPRPKAPEPRRAETYQRHGRVEHVEIGRDSNP